MGIKYPPTFFTWITYSKLQNFIYTCIYSITILFKIYCINFLDLLWNTFRYPDNIICVAVGPNPMKDIKLVAVTSIRKASDGDVLILGKAFRNPTSAHTNFPCIKSRYFKSFDQIGCYEACHGLEENEEEWSIGIVVGKCFPFHMDIKKDADPSMRTSNCQQWWTLVRMKHTCPPTAL
jgi:hypothetical protein